MLIYVSMQITLCLLFLGLLIQLYGMKVFTHTLIHCSIGDMTVILIQMCKFKPKLGINTLIIQVTITMEWMPVDTSDGKSILAQVMALGCQVTSHYLHQCWPRYLMSYGITMQQWVKQNSDCPCNKCKNKSLNTALWLGWNYISCVQWFCMALHFC